MASKMSKSKDRLLKNSSSNKLTEEEKDFRIRESIRQKSKPKINKKSDYLAQKNQSELNRFERLYQYTQIYKKNNMKRKQR